MKNLKLFIRHFQKQKINGFLSIGSLALATAVAIITALKKQISYFRSMYPGFSKEHVVLFDMSKSFRDNHNSLAMDFKAHPDIIDGCSSPHRHRVNSISRVDNQDDECLMEICFIKPNYFDVLRMSVVLSFVVPCPVAWYLMQQWLSDFEIKTEMSRWVVLLTGFCAQVITIITVSLQSYKASGRNPVHCLRYE